MIVSLQKRADGTWQPGDEISQDMLRRYDRYDKVQAKITEARSLAEHRLFRSFLKFCADNNELYETEEMLLTVVMQKLGMGKILPIPGTEHYMFERNRTSFDRMPQHKHNEFVNQAKDVICELLGIDMEDWKKEKNDGKCQNPHCNNRAVNVHEIIPGHQRRDVCIYLNLQVKICAICHAESHHAKTMADMYTLWCDVLKIDPEETKAKVKQILLKRSKA